MIKQLVLLPFTILQTQLGYQQTATIINLQRKRQITYFELSADVKRKNISFPDTIIPSFVEIRH
jgi:hypothetical protein